MGAGIAHSRTQHEMEDMRNQLNDALSRISVLEAKNGIVCDAKVPSQSIVKREPSGDIEDVVESERSDDVAKSQNTVQDAKERTVAPTTKGMEEVQNTKQDGEGENVAPSTKEVSSSDEDTDDELRVWDRVRARFDRGKDWYSGKVLAMSGDPVKYKVLYDDGDEESGIPPERISRL